MALSPFRAYLDKITSSRKTTDTTLCHIGISKMSSNHSVWTYGSSRLDSCASHRPVSHYIGKCVSESEIEHKMQSYPLGRNLAHEKNILAKARLLVNVQMTLSR